MEYKHEMAVNSTKNKQHILVVKYEFDTDLEFFSFSLRGLTTPLERLKIWST